MVNGNHKTLVEEVVETMLKQPNDVGSRIGQYRVLVWFTPLMRDPSYLMNMISMLSKKFDWESFEPGTAPVIAVHSGSIYSFKEFARQHTGLNEVDAVVLGTSNAVALEQAMAIIDNMNLEHFIKFELSQDAINIAMHILPLTGILSCDTWIEPRQSDEQVSNRRPERNHGLDVKRPRDSIEGDLFSATLEEPEALKLLLKIMSRKQEQHSELDSSSRSWDLLDNARKLLLAGAVNEAGVLAVLALEELLIPMTGWPREQVRRERLMLGKIISMAERKRKLHVTETMVLREFADLRTKCSRAIDSVPPVPGSDQDYSFEVTSLIDWLDTYPDWLR